jgi:hypothetical protein
VVENAENKMGSEIEKDLRETGTSTVTNGGTRSNPPQVPGDGSGEARHTKAGEAAKASGQGNDENTSATRPRLADADKQTSNKEAY